MEARAAFLAAGGKHVPLHPLPERPARMDRRARRNRRCATCRAGTPTRPPDAAGARVAGGDARRAWEQPPERAARACGLPVRTATEAIDDRCATRQVAVGGALLQDPRARRATRSARAGSASTGSSPSRRARCASATSSSCARTTCARTVVVKALSNVRGPAPVAQALYEETPESIAGASSAAAERKLGLEPAHASSRDGRPSATGASWPTGTAGAPRSTPNDEPLAASGTKRPPRHRRRCASRPIADASLNALLKRASPHLRRSAAVPDHAEPRPSDPRRARRRARPPPATAPEQKLSELEARHAEMADAYPARQGRSREHPPPRRGRDGQGAQVRGRELRREPAAGEGQPRSGHRHPGRDARAAARRRPRDAAPADRGARAQQGRRDQPGRRAPGSIRTSTRRSASCRRPRSRTPWSTLLQKGYSIADRVLRPALVTVARLGLTRLRARLKASPR